MERWDGSRNDEQKRFSNAEKKQKWLLSFNYLCPCPAVNVSKYLAQPKECNARSQQLGNESFHSIVKSEKPVTQSSAYSTQMFHFLGKYEQSLDDFCEEEGNLQTSSCVSAAGLESLYNTEGLIIFLPLAPKEGITGECHHVDHTEFLDNRCFPRFKNQHFWDQRYESLVKSACCSSRGCWVSSQHLCQAGFNCLQFQSHTFDF